MDQPDNFEHRALALSMLEKGGERILSDSLFPASNKLIIEHAGQDYILRVTKAGKLILTK